MAGQSPLPPASTCYGSDITSPSRRQEDFPSEPDSAEASPLLLVTGLHSEVSPPWARASRGCIAEAVPDDHANERTPMRVTVRIISSRQRNALCRQSAKEYNTLLRRGYRAEESLAALGNGWRDAVTIAGDALECYLKVWALLCTSLLHAFCCSED